MSDVSQSDSLARLLRDKERYEALRDACYEKADRGWADWQRHIDLAHQYQDKASRASAKEAKSK